MGIKGLPSKGGAERVVEAIVGSLKDSLDISVYCSKAYSGDHQEDNINLIKLPNLKGKHLSSFSLFLMSAFHALLSRRFDFIHVHNTDAGFIIPLLRLRYKIVGTCHGFPYKREKWGILARSFLRCSEALFFRLCNAVTCVSSSLSDELNSKHSRKTHYIPNGVETVQCEKDYALVEEYALKGQDYICFAAGRIDPTKGCHTLLKAFKGISRDIKLVVIGDFSHKKDYSQELHRMADDRVVFVPFVETKERLFGIIENSKIFVLPSTVEAMSMMLLEVTGLGVPTICSDIAENTSVLKDHGVYFKVGDEKELTQKIEACLDRYEELLESSRQTKEWVAEQYRWQDIAEKYATVYDSLQ
jgi:glycosyltransferase involved in cell wall biosynthesis